MAIGDFSGRLTPEQIEYVSGFIDELVKAVPGNSRFDKEEFLKELRQGYPAAMSALYLFQPAAEEGHMEVEFSYVVNFSVSVNTRRFPPEIADKVSEIGEKHGIRCYVPGPEFDGYPPDTVPVHLSIEEIPIFHADGGRLTVDELVTKYMHPVSLALKEARPLAQPYDIAAKEGNEE